MCLPVPGHLDKKLAIAPHLTPFIPHRSSLLYTPSSISLPHLLRPSITLITLIPLSTLPTPFVCPASQCELTAIMKYRYAALSLLSLTAASPILDIGTIHKDAAPILSSTESKAVPNSYIVVFKKHVKQADAQGHHSWVQSIHTKSEGDRMELRKRSQFPLTADVFEGLKHTYNIVGSLMGYSGHFDDETIEQIRRHPDVSIPS
jgi:hypothetical protein